MNLQTFEYEELKAITGPEIDQIKSLPGSKAKLKGAILNKGRVGQLLWPITAKTLAYSARLTGEIADTIVAIDDAMKWGFGWKFGPFEMWDALGVEKSVERMKVEGYDVPAWIDEMLAAGNTSFYKGDQYYDKASKTYVEKTVTIVEDKKTLADLAKSRIETFEDIPELLGFFEKVPEYDSSMYVHKKMKTTIELSAEVLSKVLPVLEACDDYSNDALYQMLVAFAKENGYKNGQVMWPIRTAVSGKAQTPGGATQLMELLGKEESLKRIGDAILKLSA